MIEESALPGKGRSIRRCFRCSFDRMNKLQYTEDLYEILYQGEVVYSERCPGQLFLRWYALDEALQLLSEGGFGDVYPRSDFTFELASATDMSFIVLGKKPGT